MNLKTLLYSLPGLVSAITPNPPQPATISCYQGNIFWFDHSPYPKENDCNKNYPVTNSFNESQTKPNMDCIRASHVEAARYKDGFLQINDITGKIHGVEKDKSGCDTLKRYRGKLITPGFIDCHNHWPQIDMVASFGGDLIEWLKTYTFKAEARNIVPAYAKASAKRFFNILARSGTTSTLALSVIFKDAIDEFFKEANRRNVRMISGLNAMSDCGDSEYPVMIDKHLNGTLVPAPLCNSLDFSDVNGTMSAEKFLADSEELIQMHYEQGQRSEYAIMPRFLLSSTPPMMEACRTLRKKYPDMKFHTHMSENLGTSVFSIFEFGVEAKAYYGEDGTEPNAEFLKLLQSKKTKFEIWDAYGLVDDKSTWGHSIHMTENDLDLSVKSGAKHCHCPTSNLFLGSGLFDMKTHIEMGIDVGMGSDIGAGTSYEMLRVMGDMYKVAMLPGSEAASIPPGTKGEFNDWFPGRPTTLEEKANGFYDYPGYSILGTGDNRTTIPYKRKYKPYPLSQMYLATLATARVMGIEDKVGSFKKGMEADFVVTDMGFSPIYKWNRKVTQDFLEEQLKEDAKNSIVDFKKYTNSTLDHVGENLEDYFMLEKELFPLIVLSDDRTTFATYIMGQPAYHRTLHYGKSLDEDYKFPNCKAITNKSKCKRTKTCRYYKRQCI